MAPQSKLLFGWLGL